MHFCGYFSLDSVFRGLFLVLKANLSQLHKNERKVSLHQHIIAEIQNVIFDSKNVITTYAILEMI